MSPVLEAPSQINKFETLSLVKGIAKSESLRSQLPSFIDEQIAFRRFAKRFSAAANFNNPNIDTAAETKRELSAVCQEMVQFLNSVQASLA